MIYLLLAILSSSAMALVLKRQRLAEGNRYGVILGNYFTCILLSLFMMRREGASLLVSSPTLLMGILAGVFFVAGLVTMQSSIPRHGATLTSAFAKLGLLVTLLVSFLWFGERPDALELLGVFLVLPALVLISLGPDQESAAEERPGKPKKETKRGSRMPYGLFLTLLAGGFADSMAKIYAELGEERESTAYFFLLFLTAALLTMVLAALEYRKTGKRIRRKDLAAGIFVGVPNYFSSYLLLLSLQTLPAFVASPLFSTGTILVVLFVSVLFLGERITRMQLLGIGFILAALVLLGIG